MNPLDNAIAHGFFLIAPKHKHDLSIWREVEVGLWVSYCAWCGISLLELEDEDE